MKTYHEKLSNSCEAIKACAQTNYRDHFKYQSDNLNDNCGKNPHIERLHNVTVSAYSNFFEKS